MIDLIIENGFVVSHNKVSNTDIAIKNGKIFKTGNLSNERSKERFMLKDSIFFQVFLILKYILESQEIPKKKT